jgi:hypothetical protein
LINNDANCAAAGKKVSSYVSGHIGATNTIVNYIKQS